MQGMNGEGCLRGVIDRHVATCAGEGWPDEDARLRDLLAVVNRTMCSDREPSRAASWWRLRRAIEDALTAP